MRKTLFYDRILNFYIITFFILFSGLAYTKNSHQAIICCLQEGFKKGKTVEECHKNCKDHHIFCGAIWRSDEWTVKTCWNDCAFLVDKSSVENKK